MTPLVRMSSGLLQLLMVCCCVRRKPQQRNQRRQQQLPERLGGPEIPGAQHLLRDALLHGARGHAADPGVRPSPPHASVSHSRKHHLWTHLAFPRFQAISTASHACIARQTRQKVMKDRHGRLAQTWSLSPHISHV